MGRERLFAMQGLGGDGKGGGGYLLCKAWVEKGREGEAICDARPGCS